MSRLPEMLDIEVAVACWDELLDRTEAGETFIISVNGEPKARLEPARPRGTDTGAEV